MAKPERRAKIKSFGIRSRIVGLRFPHGSVVFNSLQDDEPR